VGTATGYVGTVRVSIPGKGKGLCSPSERPDRLLFNGYRGNYPG